MRVVKPTIPLIWLDAWIFNAFGRMRAGILPKDEERLFCALFDVLLELRDKVAIIQPGDVMDIHQIAAYPPFATYVVLDKSMARKVEGARLGERYGVRVMKRRTLPELVSDLQDLARRTQHVGRGNDGPSRHGVGALGRLERSQGQADRQTRRESHDARQASAGRSVNEPPCSGRRVRKSRSSRVRIRSVP